MPVLLIALAFALLPGAADAHTGIGATAGFSHGFMHPFGGVDHLLAMVAVGMLAAQWGGRALWLLPASFLTTMAAGGALGMTGIALPHVEIGIGLSVVVLGLLVALGVRLPLAAAMLLVPLFAIFHGHAHGAEMPADGSGVAYGFGFLAATALLHVAGIGAGLALAIYDRADRRIAQLAGGAMSIVGVTILGGAI